jgi:hypothetical protein
LQNVKTFFFLTSLLAIGLALWRAVLTVEARRWLNARVGLVILLPGIGMLTPNIWLYYAAVIAAMLFIPRSRVEAVGLFMLIALTLPPSSTTLTAGATYLIKIDTLRLASIGLLAALRFPGGTPKIAAAAGSIFDILFWSFFLLEFALSLRAGEFSITLMLRTLLENVIPFAIPFFLLTRSFPAEADQRRVIIYLIMAGFLLSIIATFEMLRHWPLYPLIDTHLGTGNGLAKSLAIRGGLLRSPGPFQESTTFGVLLALATIATASLRSIFRSPIAHKFAILVGISGTFATLARNGWVGLALGLILLGLYKGRVARTVVLAAVAIVTFGALAMAVPKSGALGALTGHSGHAAQTSDYRERLLVVSIPVFKSSPWIGTPGAKLAERLKNDMRSRKLDVDFVNSYLYFALASGSIGLAIFVAFLWTPIVKVWRIRHRAQKKVTNAEVSAAAFACLGALSVMVFFTSFSERIPLFAVLLFGLARNVYVNGRVSLPATVRPEQPRILAAA